MELTRYSVRVYDSDGEEWGEEDSTISFERARRAMKEYLEKHSDAHVAIVRETVIEEEIGWLKPQKRGVK